MSNPVQDFIAFCEEDLAMSEKEIKKRKKKRGQKGKNECGQLSASCANNSVDDSSSNQGNFSEVYNNGYATTSACNGSDAAAASHNQNCKSPDKANAKLDRFMIPGPKGNRDLHFKDDEPVGLPLKSRDEERKKLAAERNADYRQFLEKKEREKEKQRKFHATGAEGGLIFHSDHNNKYSEMFKQMYEEEREYRENNFQLPSPDDVFLNNQEPKPGLKKNEGSQFSETGKRGITRISASAVTTLPGAILPAAPINKGASAPSKKSSTPEYSASTSSADMYAEELHLPSTSHTLDHAAKNTWSKKQLMREAREKYRKCLFPENLSLRKDESFNVSDMHSEFMTDMHRHLLDGNVSHLPHQSASDFYNKHDRKSSFKTQKRLQKERNIELLERAKLHTFLQGTEKKYSRNIEEILTQQLPAPLREKLIRLAEQRHDYQSALALAEFSRPKEARLPDFSHMSEDDIMAAIQFICERNAKHLLSLIDEDKLLSILQLLLAECERASLETEKSAKEYDEDMWKTVAQILQMGNMLKEKTERSSPVAEPKKVGERTGGGGEPVRDSLGNIITSRAAMNSAPYPESVGTIDEGKRRDEQRQQVLAYREELRKQVEDRKLAEQRRKEKERLEEQQLMQRVEQDRKRMQKQYEVERAQLIQKEQELRYKMEKRQTLQETKRIEEEKRIAEEAKKKRQERSKSRASSSAAAVSKERSSSPPVPAVRSQEILDSLKKKETPHIDRENIINIKPDQVFTRLSDIRRFAIQEQKKMEEMIKKKNSYKVMDRRVIQDDSDDDED